MLVQRWCDRDPVCTQKDRGGEVIIFSFFRARAARPLEFEKLCSRVYTKTSLVGWFLAPKRLHALFHHLTDAADDECCPTKLLVGVRTVDHFTNYCAGSGKP